MDFWGYNSNTGYDTGADSLYPDLREEMHNVLFGSIEVPKQGQYVLLREFNDVRCPACFDATTGGARRVNCAYCQGEGYQFTERVVTMGVYAGVAPVYKPSVLGTGQFPTSAFGATDPDRYTAFAEWNIYPNYERYTYPQTQTWDKLYQLKVDGNGTLVYGTNGQPIRTAKWRILAVVPQRGNHSRVEYFEIALEKETIT